MTVSVSTVMLCEVLSPGLPFAGGFNVDVLDCREVGGGVVPSFVYPSGESRGELIARGVERYLWNRAAPSWPGHLLALRDRPFSRD